MKRIGSFEGLARELYPDVNKKIPGNVFRVNNDSFNSDFAKGKPGGHYVVIFNKSSAGFRAFPGTSVVHSKKQSYQVKITINDPDYVSYFLYFFLDVFEEEVLKDQSQLFNFSKSEFSELKLGYNSYYQSKC